MKKNNIYHKEIINQIKIKYDVSVTFIRMSLKGDRKSETSDMITADYKNIETQIDKIFKKYQSN